MIKLLKVSHSFFTEPKGVINILVFCFFDLDLHNHIVSFGIKDNEGYAKELIGCWRVKHKTK